ncbi:MAG: DUF11 domain-containing protein [Pleurocapsa minor HA4230-MV1]|jgi:uncharacterized repeat protein (TIGR01451 family)|nr:DUF11 domain-containing protein [Pleurocapsa minor HA4230-MV1]
MAEKFFVNKSLSHSKTKLHKVFSTLCGQKSLAILTNIIVCCGLIPHSIKAASAQTVLSCDAVAPNLLDISNNAVTSYTDRAKGKINRLISNTNNISANINSETEQPLRLVNQGIEDLKGNSVVGLGAIAFSLVEQFKNQGLNEKDANLASLTAISAWATLDAKTSSQETVAAIKQILNDKIKAAKTQKLIAQIPDSDLLTALSGLQASNLKNLGLTNSEIEIASKSKILPQNDFSFSEQIRSATKLIAQEISQPEVKEQLINAQKQAEQDLTNLRQGKQTFITSDSTIRFKFRLDNQSKQVTKVVLPNAQAITAKGLTGSGKVTGVVYRLASSDAQVQSKDITKTAETVSIPAGKSIELDITVKVGKVDKKLEAITLNLQPSCGNSTSQSLNILPPLTINPNLIDPLGKITGCAGQILPEYLGFSVALYEPNSNDPTGSSINNITPLTATELPDDPNNNIPKGIKPNTENSNPFFLANSDQGRYSFLLDEERQQLDLGATYILVVKPPENSIYDERRVKLVIGDRQGNVVKYTATSLDGKPIRASDGLTTITGEIILVEDAERVGLDLAVLDLGTSVCDAQEIQITKTGDRASAQPGDIVLYRLAIRNLASAPIDNLQITDTLPEGFQLQTDSIKAEVKEKLIPVTATQSDYPSGRLRNRTVNFTADITLNTEEVINLVYAAQLTPNALRGSGQNSAIVNAQRTDNDNPVQDGPAIHNLRIEPGILENTGILIGRVFVDKNFDGEQQPGEPGIPEAVIFLEDGNRVITDAEGLFSVANVLPGIHTGILDLTSIPEYRLAPNLRFSEGNSKSRLVKLEPGGMVRMNFGVTPTAAGKKANSRREITPQPGQAEQKSIKSTRPNSDS